MLEDLLFGSFSSLSPELAVLLTFIILWDSAWKLFGLWKSGRNNQIWWFVFIAVLNTAGILPILYLAFFQKKIPEKKNIRKEKTRNKRKQERMLS